MSTGNNDFRKFLDNVFGIRHPDEMDSDQDFTDYLKSVSDLSGSIKMKALVEKLSLLGVLDEKQLAYILAKVEALSEEAKLILEKYQDFDRENFGYDNSDESDSDEMDCDCDFCVLSKRLESGEEENSIRSRLKKKGDEIKAKIRSEDQSKSFYVVLLQDIFKSPKTRQMKGVAFGPFSKNIAGWKISMLENRVARYSKKNKGDMVSFMKKKKGGSPESYHWNFVCAESKDKDRTSVLFKSVDPNKSSFGFMMVREDEFSGADVLDASMLKDWHLCLEPKIKSTWNIDLISKVALGFIYDQNSN